MNGRETVGEKKWCPESEDEADDDDDDESEEIGGDPACDGA